MKIIYPNSKQINECLEIAKDLKEWFTPEAIDSMKVDFQVNNLLSVVENNIVIGFICYSSYNGAIKILWIGVKKEFQRKGIGFKLLKELEKIAKKYNSKSIEVETLSENVSYKPYELTRNFYNKNGFKRIHTYKPPKEGWDDMDIMKKELR